MGDTKEQFAAAMTVLLPEAKCAAVRAGHKPPDETAMILSLHKAVCNVQDAMCECVDYTAPLRNLAILVMALASEKDIDLPKSILEGLKK